MLKIAAFVGAIGLIRPGINPAVPFIVAGVAGILIGVFRQVKGLDFELRVMRRLKKVKDENRAWTVFEVIVIAIILRMLELMVYVLIWRALIDQNMVPALIVFVEVDLFADLSQALYASLVSKNRVES